MDLKHFGDSYDIVKKSLLQWLASFGPWAAHPMFTHPVTDAEANEFSRFLGVRLVSTKVFPASSDRSSYFAECKDARSIFLDPDTGVRLSSFNGVLSWNFIFADELVQLATARPNGLVLSFDQSLARGRERQQVQAKLRHFRSRGVFGFAYVSHAAFLVLSKSDSLIESARDQVVAASGLPQARLSANGEPSNIRS